MRGINQVILVGNASRDAELRHAQTGEAVSSLRLSTNRTIKGEAATQLHTIVCWDPLAETIDTDVKKGDPLDEEGRLHPLPSPRAREAVVPTATAEMRAMVDTVSPLRPE